MHMNHDSTAPAAETIGFDQFLAVDIRVGTIVEALPFPEARKPAWKVWVDFGPYGERKTSAQITALYRPEDLLGRQVVGVINFPEKQVGPFRSQFLLTGFPGPDGVVLAVPERAVPDGTRLA